MAKNGKHLWQHQVPQIPGLFLIWYVLTIPICLIYLSSLTLKLCLGIALATEKFKDGITMDAGHFTSTVPFTGPNLSLGPPPNAHTNSNTPHLFSLSVAYVGGGGSSSSGGAILLLIN